MISPFLRVSVGALAVLFIALPGHGDDAATAAYTGTPYGGKAAVIPGKIEAEFYDVAPDAKPGICFAETEKPKKSDVRTTPDSFGLAKNGGGHVSTDGKELPAEDAYVGWTHGGEWLKYTVEVKEAGTYRIGGHIAAGGTGGQISFSFSSGEKTGPIDIPTTAGFQPGKEVYHVWETLDHLADIKLPAGTLVLTVKIEKPGGFNLDYYTFTKVP